jgi:formate hydrogenlyase subunit 6/NADH:ubiquinone oxidoreductase subunit I
MARNALNVVSAKECPVWVTEVYEKKTGPVDTSMCMLCLRCVEMCPEKMLSAGQRFTGHVTGLTETHNLNSVNHQRVRKSVKQGNVFLAASVGF